jgi:membrane protein YqaA with SNARE-associated domain
MWQEAGVLSALSFGAVLLYAGVSMSVGALVGVVFGRRRRSAQEAHEKARRRGSSASLASALAGLGVALCLAALGAFTLYVVASRLQV